ncbi:uncharacterized protein K444DRAFT_415699 [Hyaloscypha bicolor E]|uniref:Nephrocystin 3-like N-terminal domain-containing protein n=1 Tax=Hyaloscypha bicolor E TaxID=1095630 RepID=A0A2J6T6U2_9HELO|nr:uncharacterized protein K444DRAFT_415699 [Hyaloscypha bicolor E]PMD58736.1 hypothetical protein K444DRAFT_415699 [Hyaloscypha bicolor E]
MADLAASTRSVVFRVTGLPVGKAEEIVTSLTAIINQRLSPSELLQIEYTVFPIPSCDNIHTSSALVDFKNGIPLFLSHLVKQPLEDHPVETDHGDINFDRHFFGFTQLYYPDLACPIDADVIAITGIDGHAYGSWRGKGQLGRMWLRDFLSKDLPTCRTMIYGYNSKLSSRGIDKIMTYGMEFIEALKQIRNTPELQRRPIIFIAHSFGGIILAHCLVTAKQADEEDHPAIATLHKATYGILFFATPHKGLVIDDIQTMLAGTENHPRNTLLQQINLKSDLLISQLGDFKNLIRDRKIVSFFETEQTQRLEWDLTTQSWGRTGSYITAVDMNSAILELPSQMETPIPLHSDHSKIIKFESRNALGYKFALEKLNGFVADAPKVVLERFSTKKRKHPADDADGHPKRAQSFVEDSPDENNQRATARSLRQTVDMYLESIALPSTFIAKIDAPQRQATVAARSNIRPSLDWFFDSPEFSTWISGESSSFLWCSGIPKSGKTVLSCCLKNYLSVREAHMRRREIISIFCASVREQMGSIEIERILGYIASQLLRNNNNRLQTVSQQHPLRDWLPACIPLPFEGDFLKSLWGLIWDSMTASSNCEIILILDAVNEIRPQEAREAFLSNIVTHFNRARSEKHITIKVFVTSLPFGDIQKAFKDLPSIEKDKERQACLRTLRCEEYNARQNRIETAEENTGDWILSHRAFETWDKSPNSSLLWLHGKPGSGKSTLVKRVVSKMKSMQAKRRNISHSNYEKTTREVDTEYVDQLATDHNIIVASFFYSFRGGKNETSHTLMLRSLLYQILKDNKTGNTQISLTAILIKVPMQIQRLDC